MKAAFDQWERRVSALVRPWPPVPAGERQRKGNGEEEEEKKRKEKREDLGEP